MRDQSNEDPREVPTTITLILTNLCMNCTRTFRENVITLSLTLTLTITLTKDLDCRYPLTPTPTCKAPNPYPYPYS